MIAIDTETYLITRTQPNPKVVCLSYADGKESGLLVGADIPLVLSELLQQRLVGCNMAYDMLCICNTYPQLMSLIFEGYEKELYTDVAIRQQLFDIAHGRARGEDVQNYSLNYLSELVLDKKMKGKDFGKNVDEEPWRLRYSELDGVPLEQWPQSAIDYAVTDAVTTVAVYQEQEKADYCMQEQHFFTYSAFCLSIIQSRGMRTSRLRVRDFERTHTKKIKELQPILIDCGLLKMNSKGEISKDAKEAKKRVEQGHREQGFAIPQTLKGYTQIDDLACRMSGDEMLALRTEYAKAEKLLSTYLPVAKAGLSGPITTWFKMAVTGRTTSSSPRPPQKGGNLQNAPRAGGFRECHVPRDGYVYLAADFSGAELHTLAECCYHLLGYSHLGDSLNNGIDVHLKVASMLASTPYEEALAKLLEGDNQMKQARDDAKAANFGFAGGMGIKAFMNDQAKKGYVLTVDRAARAKEAWLTTWPEMSEYFDHVGRMIGAQGEAGIEIPYTKFTRYAQSFSSAANSYFQCLAAFGSREAIKAVVKSCIFGDLRGCFVVNFVHDELILEAPEDRLLTERSEVLKDLMETSFNKYVPKCLITAEPYAMLCWSKKAKPIYKEGILIPWQ